MKERLKNTKGITLVALIITIIVLLILAMVSIRLVMNGGIIGKSEKATNDYSIGEEKEQIQLGYKEYQMAQFTDTNPALKVEGANVEGTGPWTITFAKSGRVYELGTDGKIPGGEDTANLPEDAVASLAKAGEIQRWDKINYDPGTATTDSITLPAGASLNGTIGASSASDWVVLDVDQTTGDVLIIPRIVSDEGLTLDGKDGYNHGIEAINAVASIYNNNLYALNSRGLTAEDVIKATGYDEEYYAIGEENSWRHRYGLDENLDIIDAGEGNTPYPYRTFKNFGNWNFYNTKLMGVFYHCWLASRYSRWSDSSAYGNVANFLGLSKLNGGATSVSVSYLFIIYRILL